MTRRCTEANALDYLAPVADSPRFPVALSATLGELRLNGVRTTELGECRPAGPATDQAGQVATEPVTLQLYLIDSANRRLVSSIRRLEAPLTLAAKAQVAIEQLISTVGSPLPRGTEVREVWVSTAGVAYVDFATGLQDSLPGGSLPEILAVYGVVGTLTRSFPQIRAVQFLVDGRGVDTLTGHFDLTGPVSPHRDWL